MTVGAVLLVYAACTGTLGSRVLGRARWTGRAPLLAIVIYLAASWSVIAALGLARPDPRGPCDRTRRRAEPSDRGVCSTASRHVRHPGGRHCSRARPHARRRCAGPHRGHRYDPPARYRAAGIAARASCPATRSSRPALGAVLVEHPQPTAYCVAGRHPTVVLTTGAVQALDPGQLAAVLAHERAHLAAHHHWLLAMARIGRQVLPFLPLMRNADSQVTRLVEMHADDAARRASGPGPLATALVALATASAARRRP